MGLAQLKIKIKDIRSISDAEIKLDGITVIAGENGCGKSTISKLFYVIIKTIVEYDEIVDEQLKNHLYHISRAIRNLLRDLSNILDKEKNKQLRKELIKLTFDYKPDYLLSLIDYLMDITKEIDTYNDNNQIKFLLNRIYFSLKNLIFEDNDLDIIEKENIIGKKHINELFEILKESITNFVNEADKQKEIRPIEILENNLNKYFYETTINIKSIEVYESDVPLFNRKNSSILNLNLIKQVFYIETPMILGLDFDFIEVRNHWVDLNKKLKKINKNKIKIKNRIKHIDKIFEEDILSGDVLVEEDFFDNKLLYQREDKKIFELLECATGLKSFAILRLLYKNYYLNENSLIIIDEPEAHLHPQWVVEYARLIVLLNKILKVKFLIASHHPDMISAIKYIAEKEETSKNLRYYLAERIKDKKYMYKYIDLNTDIEKIFKSFNIALERIDLYGKTE